MRTKNSVAYKGVGALLLKNGAKDFSKGYTIDNISKYNSASIDIHHIFPKSYCEKIGVPKEEYDSIINKAPISYDTNISIGGGAPADYIEKYLDKVNGVLITDELLRTQLIEPLYIRINDFNSYYKARKESLIMLIEKATGNQVVLKNKF